MYPPTVYGLTQTQWRTPALAGDVRRGERRHRLSSAVEETQLIFVGNSRGTCVRGDLGQVQQVRTLHRHGQTDRQVRGWGVGDGEQFSLAGGTIWSASWSTLFNRNYLYCWTLRKLCISICKISKSWINVNFFFKKQRFPDKFVS